MALLFFIQKGGIIMDNENKEKTTLEEIDELLEQLSLEYIFSVM